MSAHNILPPLRDFIAKYNLSAKKSLGQNFILDQNINEKIARKIPSLTDSTILEIGAGPGGLTRALLSVGAKKVITIEKDTRFTPALEEIKALYRDRLCIIYGDALEPTLIQKLALSPDNPVRIVGNLPYNISTLLLTRWLSDFYPHLYWQSLTVMFQKEVGARIIAQADTKNYGRLSVISQWRTHPSIVMEISPKVFTPTPKISSVLVNMERRTPPLFIENHEFLEIITRQAFGHRRKMLRTSLKKLFKNPTKICETLGLDPAARAETLSLENFCALAHAYAQEQSTRPR